jgi:uncharacterized protein YndB with AHSA1/START domain
MTAAPLDTQSDHIATISRVMPVTARSLFLAHSKPEHLKRWFGPVDYPVTFCEADFRVGGKWRMQMTGPDGIPGPFFGGTYHEIIPDRKIVYDNGFEDPNGGSLDLSHAGRMIMTTTFDESAGSTTITVTITFASAAMKAEYLGVGMLEGIASGFDQLVVVAADLAAQT